MSLTFKNKLKKLFYKVYENHIEFQGNRNLKKDKNTALKYFLNDPSNLLPLLSLDTLRYLELLVDDNESVLKEEYVANEDFFFLICANIFVYNEGFEINKRYKPVIKAILNPHDIDKNANYVMIATYIKGLIDIYGYIETNELKNIMKKDLDVNVSNKLLYETCKYNWLINNYCVVTKKYICRREIYNMSKDFLEARSTFNFDYKRFNWEKVIRFANSFDFNSNIPFYEKQKDLFIKTSKCLSLELDPLQGSLNNFFKEGEDRIQDFFNYNLTYPKWVLKGHNVNDICIDPLFINPENIAEA